MNCPKPKLDRLLSFYSRARDVQPLGTAASSCASRVRSIARAQAVKGNWQKITLIRKKAKSEPDI